MAYLDHPSPFLGLASLATVIVAVGVTRLQAVIRPLSGRLASIDGLRGILALSVFVHHFFVAYQWKHTGNWVAPPTPLYTLMGGGSVTLFFMITGFLFFGRIKAARGRLDFTQFFAGRVFRLLPVYLGTVLLIHIIAVSQTGLPHGTALQPSLDGWLIFQPTPVNGYGNTGIIDAGVHWTLIYEWSFYCALPLLAWIWARAGFGSWLLFLLAVLALFLARTPVAFPTLQISSQFFAPFALGGLVGEVGRAKQARAWFAGSVGVLISVSGILAAYLFCENVYSVSGYLFLAVAFTPVALGNTIFGLLRTRTLMMLGEISYDVYLLHGVTLFVLYTIVMPNALAHASTPGRLFALLSIAAASTLVLAVAMHVLVERPALAFGRRFVAINRTQELAAP